MPGRNSSPGNYRFGFQGQEGDPELKGEGNSVNYKYRMHDPRVGRFLSLDPLAPDYPHNSPYAFSENRVIDRIELEGLESAEPELLIEGKPTSKVLEYQGKTIETQNSYTVTYYVEGYSDNKVLMQSDLDKLPVVRKEIKYTEPDYVHSKTELVWNGAISRTTYYHPLVVRIEYRGNSQGELLAWGESVKHITIKTIDRWAFQDTSKDPEEQEGEDDREGDDTEDEQENLKPGPSPEPDKNKKRWGSYIHKESDIYNDNDGDGSNLDTSNYYKHSGGGVSWGGKVSPEQFKKDQDRGRVKKYDQP